MSETLSRWWTDIQNVANDKLIELGDSSLILDCFFNQGLLYAALIGMRSNRAT